MKSSWTSKILTTFLLCFLASEIRGIVYKSIVWSPENPIFVEKKLKCVLRKSRLNILCPSLPLVVADTERAPIKDNLYENVWLVDRPGYDSCNITKQDNDNKKLLLCNTPLLNKYYTIVFQEMSSTVKGLEFEPGKDYFLIATSDGTLNSLDNSKGGHCRTHNMKLRFHICNDSNDPHCLSEDKCQQLVTKTIIHSDDDPGTKSSKPEYIYNHTTVGPGVKGSPSPPNVPNDAFPPNSQYMDASREVHYRLGISLLVLVSISLLTLSVFLGYRLHRKRTQQSACLTNSNFAVRMSRASEGADSADGEDSRMLVSRMNSHNI